MPGTDYTIRQYLEGDEDQIIELLELVFGEFPKMRLNCSKKEHWKWKFKDMPPGLNPTLVVLTDEGRIIGASHGQIKWTKIGSSVLLARKGAEVAVHPDYRRMGIYGRLVTKREKVSMGMGAVLSYSLISNPVIVRYKRDKKSDRYEPEFPQPLKQLMKVKDVHKFLDYQERRGEIPKGRLITSTGIKLLKAASSLRRASGSKIKPRSDYELREISAFDDRIEGLWEEVKNEYDFIVVKSKEYLNWRYCDPRGGAYRVLLAQEGDSILGFLALRVNEKDPDHPVGYIMEVLAPRERDDVADSLLCWADEQFAEENVNAVYFTVVSGHPYERLIKSHGYIDSRRSPQLFYRPYKRFKGLEGFEKAAPVRLHHQFGEYDSI